MRVFKDAESEFPVYVGIFVTPTSILRYSGSIGLSICIWILSAAISGIAALVYVELGTCIRKSGSDFAYITHARWRPLAVAFLYCTVMFARPTILAIQTLAFGEYIVEGLSRVLCISDEWRPLLSRLFGLSALCSILGVTSVNGGASLAAFFKTFCRSSAQRIIGVIDFIVFLNFFSLNKSAARFQIIATASKLCVITIIVGTGFYYLIFKGRTSTFNNSFESSVTDPGQIVLGLYAGLYAYNGWDILNYGTEEIRNPRRTLPIAACVGIIAAAIIFVAMNIAYFSVMSLNEFASSNAVAVKFAEIALGDFSYLVPFLIGLLLLGNLNTTVFACSRNLLAGANENVAPSFLKCVHLESMSPRAAVLVEGIITGGILFLGGLEQLISYMAFSIWLQRAFTISALLYMRYAGFVFPKDAFRTPIVVPICALAICVTLLVISAIQDALIIVYGGSTVLLGVFIYFFFVLPRRLPDFVHRIDESMVIAAQLSLNVMPLSNKKE